MRKARARNLLLAFLAVLIGWGAPLVRASQLNDAVKAGDLQRIQALIAAGANVNARDFVGSPLHAAAAQRSVSIARALLDDGANVAAEGLGKARPLHTAALTNHAAIATLLIQRGANIQALDSEFMTPLQVAAVSGSA